MSVDQRQPLIAVDTDPPGAPHVALIGELDLTGIERVEHALDDAIRRTQGDLVVDLSRLEFIDVSGFSLLLRVGLLLADRGATLRLKAPPSMLVRMLDLAGATEVAVEPRAGSDVPRA